MNAAEEMAAVQGMAFMDGRYVPLAEAAIPVVDRGFVRSDATYDALHVWQGRVFRLHDHLQRFRASMRGLRMTLPYDDAALADIIKTCVRRSSLRDAFVMLVCTRGVPPPGTRDPRLCRNRLYAWAQPFLWMANEQQRREGLRMVLTQVQRIPPESLDQRIKNFHWLDLTMGLFDAYERDATVAVLPGSDGGITEGPGFNVFVVKNGALATPERGLFEGITRRTVTEIAAALNLPCTIRKIQPQELLDADEIFTSTTAGGITPVTWYEGRPVGNGRPGPLTQRVHDRYWQLHEDPALNTPIDDAGSD